MAVRVDETKQVELAHLLIYFRSFEYHHTATLLAQDGCDIQLSPSACILHRLAWAFSDYAFIEDKLYGVRESWRKLRRKVSAHRLATKYFQLGELKLSPQITNGKRGVPYILLQAGLKIFRSISAGEMIRSLYHTLRLGCVCCADGHRIYSDIRVCKRREGSQSGGCKCIFLASCSRISFRHLYALSTHIRFMPDGIFSQ
ncbi:hypothetical protein F4776DRAFT_317945 [Hypoxylon sp. NC0597]|nr:hypothetical protein F4776DRAFT_317945 [Hypoxylon sp. NC0597]